MRIGYARVSTIDQSPELQFQALTAAGCERVYGETASGDDAGRPELKRVLEDVLRDGDTLVVWKLDRLGRDLRHLVNVVQNLTERAIGLRVLAGQGAQIDTTTPNGKLVFGIFAALAEYERELIVERTNAGLRAARARGRLGGRPRKMTRDTADGDVGHERPEG